MVDIKFNIQMHLKKMRTQIQYNTLCLYISAMSEDVQNQDKAIEKIHREENLDDGENDYTMLKRH